MPSLRSVVARGRAELRALRFRRRPGVTIGRGVRFGPGADVRAAPGGQVAIGDGVEIAGNTGISAQPGASVVIGNRVFISGGGIIAAHERIEIGADSMIAELVCIRDHDHDPDAPPRSGRTLSAPVHVGERVWLASKCSVVRGGRIGDDSVIGAHALVNRPIPSGVIAAGVPARVVRAKNTGTPDARR